MQNKEIAIIGLGYVGLPLGIEFAKKNRVVGLDIDAVRVDELKKGRDITLEVDDVLLNSVLQKSLNFTEKGFYPTINTEEIKSAQIYIITVPTPVTKDKRPDFQPLIKASETVGKALKNNDIVIYESTVFPGATEEICIPVLEEKSGLNFNEDFFVGYSPERINPGDKVNTLVKIKKVTSGSTPEIADEIDQLYNTILENGTFKASSIKVAEASKVIENAQRDLNISFVNELALIFDRIGIDTNDVIDAASSKWNFLKFKPGLVGGHCISIDPYYLKWKAEQLGYHPDLISAGRRVNDMIGSFVANKLVKLMINKEIRVKNSNILVLGITFKENCPDIRNTKVVDIISELEGFGCQLTICDPWIDMEETQRELGLNVSTNLDEVLTKKFDAVVLAVAHKQFLSIDLEKLKGKGETVIFDIKSVWDKNFVDSRL